ncbi:hypothetical protein D8I24_6538 [Cupriavidus necator H850]|uniref:phage head spike fiber domain-containing protein n=1 Tax=Cupriavidus necator TaxID=106590 RepID=UPI00129D984E|nr:hypothetical protein [Cupriavidus necator]KAI3597722.1 hypothetical protein D8I24_6538 [Cupriavidus necator H850]
MLTSKNFSDIVAFTRASAAWRYSSGGILVQESANVPRLGYDPITLAARGLLVEEQRTNEYLNSRTFSSATRNSILPLVDVTATDGPFNGTTVKKAIPDTSNVIHYLGGGGFGDKSTKQMTFYAIVKAAGYNFIRIDLFDSANHGSYFDLAAGTLGTLITNGATMRRGISPLGGGWYLCWVSMDVTSTNPLQPNLWITSADNQVTFAADGSSGVLLGTLQVEQGAFPGSTIVTTGAQVTRVADSAVITDLSKIGWNASGGTLVIEFEQFGTGQIASFDDGTNNNRICFLRSQISENFVQTRFRGAGVDTANLTVVAALNARNKVAMSWGAGQLLLSANGSAAATQALASAIPAVSAFRFGAADGSSKPNAWIRTTRYLPAPTAAADLPGLST